MKYNPRKPVSLAERREVERFVVQEIEDVNLHGRTLTHCPDCGAKLSHAGGCLICHACGWDACSIH